MRHGSSNKRKRQKKGQEQHERRSRRPPVPPAPVDDDEAASVSTADSASTGDYSEATSVSRTSISEDSDTSSVSSSSVTSSSSDDSDSSEDLEEQQATSYIIQDSPYENDASAEAGEPIFEEILQMLKISSPESVTTFGGTLANSVVLARAQIEASNVAYKSQWRDGLIQGVNCGYIPKSTLLVCLSDRLLAPQNRLEEEEEEKDDDEEDDEEGEGHGHFRVLRKIVLELGVPKIVKDAIEDWELEEDFENLSTCEGKFIFPSDQSRYDRCAIFVARAYRCMKLLKKAYVDESLMEKVQDCLILMDDNLQGAVVRPRKRRKIGRKRHDGVRMSSIPVVVGDAVADADDTASGSDDGNGRRESPSDVPQQQEINNGTGGRETRKSPVALEQEEVADGGGGSGNSNHPGAGQRQEEANCGNGDGRGSERAGVAQRQEVTVSSGSDSRGSERVSASQQRQEVTVSSGDGRKSNERTGAAQQEEVAVGSGGRRRSSERAGVARGQRVAVDSGDGKRSGERAGDVPQQQVTGGKHNGYGDNDILLAYFDKSVSLKHHPGNKRYLAIVEKYRPEYQNAKAGTKQTILKRAWEEIESNGARFMMNTTNKRTWVAMETSKVHKKLCNALRLVKKTENDKEYGENDILLCSNRASHRDHPGNVRYCAIVEKHLTEYRNTERGPIRQAVLKKVLEEIQSNGARFITSNSINKAWFEMGASDIRIELSNTLRYFESRTQNDRSKYYSEYDILCGVQSAASRAHLGNKRYHGIVDKYRTEYLNAEMGSKQAIVEKVLNEVQLNGTRFLTYNKKNKSWYNMETSKVYTKIYYALHAKPATENDKPNDDEVREGKNDEKLFISSGMTQRKKNGARGTKIGDAAGGGIGGTVSPDGVQRQRVSNGKNMDYGKNDILIVYGDKKSVSSKDHPGNLRYQAIVQQYKTEFGNTQPRGPIRRALLQKVLEQIQSNGARFMMNINNNQTWVEMETIKVRLKLSAALLYEAKNDKYGLYQEKDILLCGGAKVSLADHPGNVRYQTFLEKHCTEYRNAKRGATREAILQKILDEVQSNGSRFMRCKQNIWLEMETSKVRMKVSDQLLRFVKPVPNVATGAPSINTFGSGVGGDDGGAKRTAHPRQVRDSGGSNGYCDDDILCDIRGKSRFDAVHRGNKRYCAILGKYRDKYRKAETVTIRRAIRQKVLEEILSNGARFLEKSGDIDNPWTELIPKQVKAKLIWALGYSKTTLKTKDGLGYRATRGSAGAEIQSIGRKRKESSSSGANDDQDQTKRLKSRVATAAASAHPIQRQLGGNDGYRDNDVLSDERGAKRLNEIHPGNRRYCAIVQKYCGEYRNATVLASRQAIRQKALEEIVSNGARFLQKKNSDNGMNQAWTELNATQIDNKLTYSLGYSKATSRTKKGKVNRAPRGSAAATNLSRQPEETSDEESGATSTNDNSDDEVNEDEDGDAGSSTKVRATSQSNSRKRKDPSSTNCRGYRDQTSRRKIRVAADDDDARPMESHIEDFGGSNGYSDNDILCDIKGMARYDAVHPGNKRYCAILKKYYLKYRKAKTPTRKTILEKVKKEIFSNGARFLEKKNSNKGKKNPWTELPPKQLRSKITWALGWSKTILRTQDGQENRAHRFRGSAALASNVSATSSDDQSHIPRPHSAGVEQTGAASTTTTTNNRDYEPDQTSHQNLEQMLQAALLQMEDLRSLQRDTTAKIEDLHSLHQNTTACLSEVCEKVQAIQVALRNA